MKRSALLLCAVLAVLTSPATAATFKVLHDFGEGADGSNPLGPLAFGANGFIYGTTTAGGTASAGTVFVVHPNGFEKVLHSFLGDRNGGTPASGLVADADGIFYGTAEMGGVRNNGTIFKVAPTGKLTTLYRFPGGRNNGSLPVADVAIDDGGVISGTTSRGGSKLDAGTVFRRTPDGTVITLHVFNIKDGAEPDAGVVADSDGALYGTARLGGASSGGVVYRIAPDGTRKVLHAFAGIAGGDGSSPQSGLVFGMDGKLYGTASLGGANNGGILFRISPNGGNYEIVHAFKGNADGSHDGEAPTGNLAIDGDGNIFGTTRDGGPSGVGIVFEFAADGTYRVIHAFDGANDGTQPSSGVVIGPNGLLYGTAVFGGANNKGTLFSIKLQAN